MGTRRRVLTAAWVLVCSSLMPWLRSTAVQAQVPPSIHSSHPAARIVGGDVVVSDTPGTGPYPWMTPLLFTPDGVFDPTFSFQFCGGTFIGPNHVLTAAHCIDNSSLANPNDISVGVGFQSISRDAASAQIIPVSQILIHPNGAADSIETADMAILVLGEPANLDTFITFNQMEIEPGTIATVIGWGTTFEGGPSSDALREVQVPVVSFEQCQANLADLGGIDATMLCAGLDEGGADSCQGDSGGPLFITDRRNRPVQIGVVSWGNGCARPGRPGVYADVANLADFIFRAVTRTSNRVGGLAIAATTPNQLEVARSLDSFAASLPDTFDIDDMVRVYTDLVLSSTAQRQIAFESLMPRTAFAQVNLAQQMQVAASNQITSRARTLRAVDEPVPLDMSGLHVRSLPTTPHLPLSPVASTRTFEDGVNWAIATYPPTATIPLAQTDSGKVFDPPQFEVDAAARSWRAFLAGDIVLGRSDLDVTATAEADLTSYLLLLGADYPITPTVSLGGSLAYGAGEQENSLFSTNVDTVLLTAYGIAEYGTGGYTTAYLGYGFDSYDTRRTILLPSETRRATGSNRGNQVVVGMETGWIFQEGALRLEPFLGLRHTSVNLDDYTESRAGAVSLEVDDRTSGSTLANLGINIAYALPLEDAVLVPLLGLGVNHELDASSQQVTASFVGGGVPFTIATGDLDRTWFTLVTGLTAQFGPRTMLRVLYRTDLDRTDANLHSVSAELNHTF